MDQPLDHELVAHAMHGDRIALDALWRSHRRLVAAVLMAHLPREVELADLLQDVATKMVSQIHTLKSSSAFRPWLRAIARNVAISSGRRQQTRRGGAELGEIDPIDPCFERDVEQGPVREQLDRTLAIVAGLHLDYREPLLMRCVQGMSQKEIASALDLPVTTVETRLARARRLLRRELTSQTQGAALGPASKRNDE